MVTEALRALREAEEEASRLREEVKSSSDENKVLRERLDGLVLAPVASSVAAVEARLTFDEVSGLCLNSALRSSC